MATIKKTATVEKNSNRTPKGTMPKDQLARFGMKANLGSSEDTGEGLYGSPHQRNFIRRMTRRVSTLRLMLGSKETHLPSPLKASVRYFAIPMGRDGSGNYSANTSTPTPAQENAAKTA